ncbi:MAG: PEP-CTERM sorting domain-containing protein [Planctomycetota bacterium]
MPEPTASWLLATLAGFTLTRTRRRIT